MELEVEGNVGRVLGASAESMMEAVVPRCGVPAFLSGVHDDDERWGLKAPTLIIAWPKEGCRRGS